MKIANDVIKAVTDNYGYHFASWQPERIKNAVSKVDQVIADVLDYSDANALAQSLAKALKYDITNLLVKNKYPVWVDPAREEIITLNKRNLVITYASDKNEFIDESISRMSAYAKNIDADFIVLSDRTQGLIDLEIFRLKKYVEAYDRVIFFNINLCIRENCPNLFNIVPSDKIGMVDINLPKGYTDEFGKYRTKRIRIIQFEALSRNIIIDGSTNTAFEFEADQIESNYDNCVIVCSKKHADIFNPITFPFKEGENYSNFWMELSLHRDGHDIFNLDTTYNQNILSYSIDNKERIHDAKIINYMDSYQDYKIINTWKYDNNIVGYKEKEPLDMNQFKILVLTHKDSQKFSIEKRDYLEFIDLNNIGSKFDNSFTESRIFYMDFDDLFQKNEKYIGLVTGSWNLKYIGINPIDQLHNWSAIRRLNDDKTIICSNIERVCAFIGNGRIVLKDVFTNIKDKHIEEFLQLINLEVDIKKYKQKTGVSNQIIAKRNIVKSLFDFYQQNEILDKVKFLDKKYNLETTNEEVYEKRNGYFCETATALWMINQEYFILPQEILKNDWYSRENS